MQGIELVRIGVVRSPYTTVEQAPRQGRPAGGIAEIEVDGKYLPALDRIDNARHLIVLTWLHLADRNLLRVIPPGEREERGVFAARSPHRPNPIGHCVVDLLGRKGNVLTVRGLDAINGTPVIDIKPFVPELDCAAGPE
jgi:tRNA-Thr(GGU) m(6)t(6)A37 methyltransferase TsaA